MVTASLPSQFSGLCFGLHCLAVTDKARASGARCSSPDTASARGLDPALVATVAGEFRHDICAPAELGGESEPHALLKHPVGRGRMF